MLDFVKVADKMMEKEERMGKETAWEECKRKEITKRSTTKKLT